ncbi:HNH endonuclease [Streptomyces ardesiacus]|uniref:HNH endonuclease n=1 Tax=Streptomyces ardesiacus TaxID=285564 RepID=UPI000D59EFCC|nr:HNH endonuclease signature motif containing protein [Streptomyces ardesiacus]
MATRNTRSQRRRRDVIAHGPNAAALLRRHIREEYAKHGRRPQCARCPAQPLPSLVDVDHVVPIHKGGTDTSDNVQVLCKPCHRVKTHRDCGYSTPLF